MNEKKIGVPMEDMPKLARVVAAQGAVLLENEGNILPITTEDHVAVFGRCQLDYYRTGTGSGGAVNVAYSVNLMEGLRGTAWVKMNEPLSLIYENWVKEHPFDNGGGGWAAEPWHQEEMELEDTVVEEAAEISNKAIVVIGRTAGEDQDNAAKEGSYLLTKAEERMLLKVTNYFTNVVVLLNVSNIIDMKWSKEEQYKGHIKGILYVWHGGSEGGNAAADLLTGAVNPSGKLSDTIAYSIEDYPSTAHYGNLDQNYYTEDIYVGYKYFETFDPEKVMYPFGYGLSYTDFVVIPLKASGSISCNGTIEVLVEVRNLGEYAGKEVVQLYVEAPQGDLGRPAKELIGFAKTDLLQPGTSECLQLSIPARRMAAFDDSGVTGHRSCFVLEAGEYRFYLGNSVRQTELLSFEGKNYLTLDQGIVVEELEEACAPTQKFERIKPGKRLENGTYEIITEAVPLRTTDLSERMRERLPKKISYTGDLGISFQNVMEGNHSIEELVAQLSVEELMTMVRGEGMCSYKVTPGTAAAFGGISDALQHYGIPTGCCADGPSGIRMDTGAKASQVPIGTLLACSFDVDMVAEIFELLGKELVRNEIDSLLGPGLNLHRNPLNGRNFEYFSEDPFLTGQMAAANIRGLNKGGATGTMKHFACNNQETSRQQVDAVVSERALRETYLKGFEIAVKEGKARSIMTTYNPINGYWNASNYDLNTTILREQWGYQGIVMTDWWAQVNDVELGGAADHEHLSSMVRAQNDLYMVVNNNGAEINSSEDDLPSAFCQGKITLGELQRSARNIIHFLLQAPAATRPVKIQEVPGVDAVTELPVHELVHANKGISQASHKEAQDISIHMELLEKTSLWMEITKAGIYGMDIHVMSADSNRAQLICHFDLNGERLVTFQTNGTMGKWNVQRIRKVHLTPGYYELKIEHQTPGITIDWIEYRLLN